MSVNDSIPQNNLSHVSIVVVTYNAAKTLQRCLDSIYRQTYPFLNIIIMDGASNDGTIEILKENSDKIMFWQSEPDKGIYYAMNKGLQYLSGYWAYFLGADDELRDDFSKFLFELKNKSTIYYGKVLWKNLVMPFGPVSAYKHAKDTICHQAIVYPAEIFKKYTYNTTYPITADHLLNMQLWRDKKYKFEFIDLIIANFNDTGVSSISIDRKFKQDQAFLVLKYHGPVIWLRYIFKKFKEKFKKSDKSHQETIQKDSVTP